LLDHDREAARLQLHQRASGVDADALDEGLEHAFVKMPFLGPGGHFHERLGRIPTRLVRSVGGDGVVHIAHRAHLGEQADLVALEPFGVATAIDLFVMVQAHVECDRAHATAFLEQAMAGLGVAFHDGKLFLRERTGLVEHLGGLNLRTQSMRLFDAGADKRGGEDETVSLNERDKLHARFGHEWELAEANMALMAEAAPAFDLELFLAAKQTPVFFGSAVNNFGVQEVLDALVDLAPAPRPRFSTEKDGSHKEIAPDMENFSGVVFKVQANMDPSHRDRIAFVRVCSGKYTPGMKLKVQRSGKELRPTSVVTFLSQRREAVDEAFAGDIIGFTTHGGVQLGDTITDGITLQYTGLPFFAPELFQTVELANPMKSKQLQAGLMQLGEEGAIQVFRPEVGGSMLLGAVGQLQFEVVQHRLKAEYSVDIRLMPCRFVGARWITADTPEAMKKFCDENASKLALDAADTLAYMMTSAYDLRLTSERHPQVHFHPLREHAGLSLSNQ
jgi:peptide chain release factor 3